MSEILSKEQIDQLLSAGGFSETGTSTESAGASTSGAKYESLAKPFDLFCQQMSSVLKTVLNKTVAVQLVKCAKADANEIKNELKQEEICVALPFKSGFTGEAYLFINKKDTAVLGDLMMMGEGNAEYGPEHNDAITEMSSQILSSFALALTSELGTQISAGPSKISDYSLDKLPPPAGELAMVIASLSIEGKPDSRFAVIIPDSLASQMAGPNASAVGSAESASAGGGADFSPANFSAGTDFGSRPQTAAPIPQSATHRQENIDMLLDVDLDVSIELGGSNMSIKRILELAPGSVVELDRMAGEPVDLMVNSKVVAKGEVVVIDESFGIRILSLISPEERIKSLR
jgi:flagellar motor switch protein FliN